jgi:serine/threonine protein kinase
MKESELSMFANEIKIVKGLDHPNIQRVYGVYEDEKRYYLVTDIC